ncbi:gp12 [Shigella phage Buco]|uniref:Uncharacterized protein n=1 Tax=Shigella phage Buco TaxID=2530183 RepID=A0A482JJM2_9CAUD|nr:gp12 [Shigella phage Buco]QBP32912.1 hypothetical protein HRP29_gp12 [Shigella phage Buco]
MAKIEYTSAHPTVQVGIPFTWGINAYWYIQSSNGYFLCLNDGKDVTQSIDPYEILSERGFRYATSMELK